MQGEKVVIRTMEINDIKKALYKEKHIAFNSYKDNVSYCYTTELNNGVVVDFKVPIKEMGEKPFDDEIPAQLLIRWIL